MTLDPTQNANLFARRALVVAVVAAVVSVVAGASNLDLLLRAYLVGWLFWLGITMGCYAMQLLHNLTGGKWGFAVRPWAKAASATLPLMALLFVPIGLGLDRLYIWADPEIVAHDHLLQHKEPYLNPTAFLIRAAAYFILWIGIGFYTQRKYRRVIETGDPHMASNLRLVSGVGLGVFGLTSTFAAVDWAMSLQPHWFSSIYGVMWIIGQALCGLAFVIAASLYFSHRGWDIPLPTTAQMHDLGKLLFGFTMLWAYMSLMQFVIMWYGNLPEDVPWYLQRSTLGWQYIVVAIVLFHFFLPFFLLLSRRMKRNPHAMVRIAAWLLVMEWVNIWWLIEPSYVGTQLYFPWRDIIVTVAIGGLWLATFAWNVPQGDDLYTRASQSKAAA